LGVIGECGGGDLLSLLTKYKKFHENDAQFYVAEISAGLGHLHSKGLIFRDLKPENVVLDIDGHAMLTDFGIAKAGVTSDDMDSSKTFCGSPMYLAPEMLQRKGHGQPLDWYSMGALLYELVSGLPPFYSQDRQQLFQNILNAPLNIPRNITDACRSLIESLLKRNPTRRLGAGTRGFEDIKEHEFFAPLDWEDLLQRKVRPPIKPVTKAFDPTTDAGLPDLSNFSKNFLNMPITEKERGLTSGDGNHSSGQRAPASKAAASEAEVFKKFDFQVCRRQRHCGTCCTQHRKMFHFVKF